MTTEVRVSVAADVFEANEVTQLPRVTTVGPRLAGIRFLAEAAPKKSRDALRSTCLDVGLQQFLRVWPNLKVNLFACTSAWQPKNRLSRHRGLWRFLEM